MNPFLKALKEPIAAIGLIALLFSCSTEKTQPLDTYNWSSYLGGLDRNQYAPLSQINRSNVQELKPVWEYHAENGDSSRMGMLEHNPLIIDGILYGASSTVKVFALNAVTGEQLWSFDHQAGNTNPRRQNQRGLVYYSDDEVKRIYFTAGNELIALDARTGKPLTSFGVNGRVPLKIFMEETGKEFNLRSTSPGVIYNDFYILASAVGESLGAPPGDIQAYNIHTGELAWSFHTIPRPGEYGYHTWPADAWQYIGGANAWSGLSLDAAKGIVYAPTGSATFDFYGGNRPGANLFANSLIALNANTGERIWHYQIVHHDLWDRDLPAPPNLVTINRNGKKIDAVAQVTKHGYVYMFDRYTGDPVFPIEERPVPMDTELNGEQIWPTQPIPVKPPPFTRMTFNEHEIGNLDPAAKDSLVDIWRRARKDHLYAPPAKEGTLVFPGFTGGAEWGGAAVDPTKGIMYVNSNEMPNVIYMKATNELRNQELSAGARVYQNYCVSCHGPDMRGNGTIPSIVDLKNKMNSDQLDSLLIIGRNMMPTFSHLTKEQRVAVSNYLFGLESAGDDVHQMDDNDKVLSRYNFTGYNRYVDSFDNPVIDPPWGQLSAIDLNKGEILWQVPLGELDELTARGIPQTGTENLGGPIVTAGGLIFIASTKDEYFRAFDQHTGEEVWKFRLPAAGYATPSTYMVDGKQYLVLACAGSRMGTVKSDLYVAFALP